MSGKDILTDLTDLKTLPVSRNLKNTEASPPWLAKSCVEGAGLIGKIDWEQRNGEEQRNREEPRNREQKSVGRAGTDG